MKGIIFCEFLKMVDSHFSADMTEQIIENCNLPSQGAYTEVGTYDYREIVALVTELAKQTGTPVPELIRGFGQFLASSFEQKYPEFFSKYQSVFELLENVEEVIHKEVSKLYPEAELPSLLTERLSPSCLVVIYRSCRQMGDLVVGLIGGCAEYYGKKIVLRRHDYDVLEGQYIRFQLEQVEG